MTMTREQQFIHFFEHLTPENLTQIDTLFAADAHFKDPFNDVIGRKAIQNIFLHMFATTANPQFTVQHFAINQSHLFLQWFFQFETKQTNWQIIGCSHICFNDHDQVQEHIDFWDPAEQLYSKITLLRPLMNFLARRLTANAQTTCYLAKK